MLRISVVTAFHGKSLFTNLQECQRITVGNTLHCASVGTGSSLGGGAIVEYMGVLWQGTSL